VNSAASVWHLTISPALLQQATQWNAAERTETRLLFGADIAAAKAWVARRPKDAPEPTPLHYELIQASEEAESRRKNAERQQLQEIAAAQAERSKALVEKEEAQSREAEQARRVVRRTLVGMVAAMLLAAVALGAGVVAVINQREAERQRLKAVEQQALADQQKTQAEVNQAKAEVSQADALALVSYSLFDKGQELDAFLTALKAGNILRFFADWCCEKGAPSGQLEVKTPLYLSCPSWATG
jgi:hypothetical protein